MNWRPGATNSSLRQRAELLKDIRRFFDSRGVLEVETPLLAAAPVTDPHIQALAVPHPCGDGQLWLQTSPEYAMKRLLAADLGAIYQICKAFRKDEAGSRHNPEFTLLEWYRPGFDLAQLQAEALDLLAMALGQRPHEVLSYAAAFQCYLQIDISNVDDATLVAKASAYGDWPEQADRSDCLDFLFATAIEPQLGRDVFTVICDYPAAQAALAQTHIDEHGQQVASRFELYVDGIELANAYHELLDADEHRCRFQADLAQRRNMGLDAVPVDEALLAALDAGLPACSGIALGLDRLLMIKLGASSIDEVLAFSLPRL